MNKNYMSVKRRKTEPTKSTQSLCDLSDCSVCEMQKVRSVLVHFFDTFEIHVPTNCSSDTKLQLICARNTV